MSPNGLPCWEQLEYGHTEEPPARCCDVRMTSAKRVNVSPPGVRQYVQTLGTWVGNNSGSGLF